MFSCLGQYIGADLRGLRIGFTGGANFVLLASVAAKAGFLRWCPYVILA